MSATALGCPTGLAPAAGANGISTDPTPFVTAVRGRCALDIVVRGASCGGCLAKIEKAVGGLDGVEAARLNLSSGRLHVEWRGKLDPRLIMDTLAGLGYGAAALDPGKPDQ